MVVGGRGFSLLSHLRVVSCVVISRILNPSINGFPLYVDLAEIFCHVFYEWITCSLLFILDHFYCNELKMCKVRTNPSSSSKKFVLAGTDHHPSISCFKSSEYKK